MDYKTIMEKLSEWNGLFNIVFGGIIVTVWNAAYNYPTKKHENTVNAKAITVVEKELEKLSELHKADIDNLDKIYVRTESCIQCGKKIDEVITIWTKIQTKTEESLEGEILAIRTSFNDMSNDVYGVLNNLKVANAVTTQMLSDFKEIWKQQGLKEPRINL